MLARVVEHYHRTFCERKDAQEYLAKRGLTDVDLLRALKVIPKNGPLREQLLTLGVITVEGRELLGGCVVVPIPDPLSGEWTSLYGRGLRTPRHCYLPGPLRGVLNFQAARSSSEVILTESILDALSFHQAGIATAIPIYGTSGFTPDHFDLLKREQVKRVILALDGDAAGRKATDALKEKLSAAGIAVAVMAYPPNLKDPNEVLVSRNGDAGEVFRALLDGTTPRPEPPVAAAASPLSEKPAASAASLEGQVVLVRDGLSYHGRVQSTLSGRLRVTVKVTSGESFHVDTLDLYASRSRTEFARRASKALVVEAAVVEADLLALLVEAEKAAETTTATDAAAAAPPPMTDGERAEALALLRRPDLLDQIARDIDGLGYVGEDTNKRLLYLVAVSRKLEDPLSAIVLSQSGAGKSGLTEVLERLTPPEDVVLLTRLTPQSLYYVEPGFLDRKLVIVAGDRGGALRLGRSGLLDPGPAEPEEADRRRTREGSRDRQHAHQDLHGGSPRRLHRGHHRRFRQPRERDALLRAGHGRDRGADAAHPRAPASAAHRTRPGPAPASGRDRTPPLERAAPLGVAIGGDPVRGQAGLSHRLDADAARPRALPEPDRGLGLPAPAPARAPRRRGRRVPR